jgi:hypothetical protein
MGTHNDSNDIVVHSFVPTDRNCTNLSSPCDVWKVIEEFQLRWQPYNPKLQPSSCPWSDFGTIISVVDRIHNIAVLATRTIISCEQSLWHYSADCVVANTPSLHYLQSRQQELMYSQFWMKYIVYVVIKLCEITILPVSLLRYWVWHLQEAH